MSRRRGRGRVGAAPAGLLVVVAVTALMIALTPGADLQRGARLFGLAPDPPRGPGSHAFLVTQPGSEAPVTFDPCRDIAWVHNPEAAPRAARELIEASLARVTEASGFRFRYLGESEDDHRTRTQAADPPLDLPVLVAWSAETEIATLAGRVAGFASSLVARAESGAWRFHTGMVVLDADVFGDLLARPGGRLEAGAILDHEFAHLLGLDHVDDPGELMNEENLGLTAWGPGDEEGLARLGAAPCTDTASAMLGPEGPHHEATRDHPEQPSP